MPFQIKLLDVLSENDVSNTENQTGLQQRMHCAFLCEPNVHSEAN